MNKDCEIIKDLIPLYVDGVCSEESKAKVEEHIEHCPDCLMTVERMKSHLVLPMEDSSGVKGFKKFVNKKIRKSVGGYIDICAALDSAQLGDNLQVD